MPLQDVGTLATVTLRDRLLGGLWLLRHAGRAAVELAAAFPDRTAAERGAIARRSAWLQARRGRERFASRDAVALCRHLSLDGAEALAELRASADAAVFTAPFGAPALALRAVRLYGGDPQRTVTLLPAAGEAAARFDFLGRSLACTAAWPGAGAAAIFPVFGVLEAKGATRVVFAPALAPPADAGDATAAALAAIERAVRGRPEAWPWGAGPR